MVPRGYGVHYSPSRDFITLAQASCVHGIKLIPWFMTDAITVMPCKAAQLTVPAKKKKKKKNPYRLSNHFLSDCGWFDCYCDVTRASWRLKSPATGLHVWLFVRADNKETAKLRISDPLCVVTGAFSPRRASNTDRVSMSWRHHVNGIWLRNEQMYKQHWPPLLTCINFNPNMDK